MKFKAPIEIQAGISDGDPTNPLGISGYLLSSDGSNVNWVSPGELSAETAEAIVQPIKANEALVKGDPLYIVGYQSGQNVNIVAKADSSDVAKMPVVGLADDDYANQAFGTMTAFGSFNGDFDTTGGTESWAIGDIIFVKPGGGLTNIKPGGTDLIQNVAIVSRVNSQTGELEVIALGRTNDVPNLPEGRLFVGTAANTSLASDVVYVDDTNDRVGIGTTTPSTDLEISSTGVNGVDISQSASNATQSGRLFFTTNTASEGFALFNANGTFQVNSGGIPNDTSGTNRISIIGSSGNVGIGTTSPNAKLDVYGGLHLGTTGNFSITQSPFTTTNFYITGGGNGGLISFGAPASNTQNVSVQGDLYSYQGSIGTQQFGSFNNKISYNGDNYLNSGNLGIGTTSPSSKLHVEDSISNGSLFKITTSTSGSLQPVFDARIESNGDTYYDLNNYKSATKKIQIKSSNTSYIQQVDGTGGFDIKGHLKTSLQTVNGGGVLQLHRYGALSLNNDDAYAHTPSSALYINTFSNTSTDYLMLLANQGSDKLAVDLNGNVGIGTTNPNSRLEVNGEIDANGGDGYRIEGKPWANWGSNLLTLGDWDGEGYATRIMGSNSSEVMRVTGNNVGIGTTSPRTKLHVTGLTGDDDPALGSSTAPFFVSNTSTSYGLNIGVNNVGASWLQSQSNTSSTAYNLLLNPLGGNIGIGTTSPSEKLEVNGYVKASSGYKGYLPAFQHGGFYHSSSSSSSTIYWIPTNYFSETTSSQYYNNWVAPYSGRVKKIVMRWASGTTPTATSVTFRKSINGGGDLSTYPATIANAASTTMTATRVFGSTDIAFNEGDRVRIGFTTDGGTRLLYGFAYTIVLEYNKD